MRKITLQLPITAAYGKKTYAMSNNILDRLHWVVAHKVKKSYAINSIIPRLAAISIGKPFDKFKVSYQFTFKSNRRKDPSNYWAVISKVLLDCLQDRDIIADDSHANHTGTIGLQTVINKLTNQEYVTITITEDNEMNKEDLLNKLSQILLESRLMRRDYQYARYGSRKVNEIIDEIFKAYGEDMNDEKWYIEKEDD